MTSLPIPPNYPDHILVASPSPVVRQRVLESLRSPARRFEQASGGAEALVHLESGYWQALFLDRQLPDLDAEELSHTVRRRYPEIEVVLLNADGDADACTDGEKDRENIDAARPLGADELQTTSKQADICDDSSIDRSIPGRSPAYAAPLPGMIGNSRMMQPVYRLARLVAARNTSVLITGPTGSGKELVARAIHQLSPRAGRGFAVVNCAAIPETMLEAVLRCPCWVHWVQHRPTCFAQALHDS